MMTSTNATALISVLHSDLIPETPKTITPDNHFKLGIDDIESPFDGLHHAELKHIEALCDFVHAWHDQTGIEAPTKGPNQAKAAEDIDNTATGAIVVHCYAGISRSTAAAFVMLCALNPKADELAIANYMRSCSATAAPNRLIVSLGDAVLDRNGRMIKAIRAMDRSLSYEQARPFALRTKFDPAGKGLFSGSQAA